MFACALSRAVKLQPNELLWQMCQNAKLARVKNIHFINGGFWADFFTFPKLECLRSYWHQTMKNVKTILGKHHHLSSATEVKPFIITVDDSVNAVELHSFEVEKLLNRSSALMKNSGFVRARSCVDLFCSNETCYRLQSLWSHPKIALFFRLISVITCFKNIFGIVFHPKKSKKSAIISLN